MKAAVILLSGALAACQGYRPLPLPAGDALARDLGRLRVDAAEMPVPALASHRFDPSDGLDITEVAMLAVVDNPELRQLRAEAGIARAQAFSAGLLPDPQLAFSRESVLGAPAGSTVAYTAGLTVDVAALLAHSSARAASDSETRKADLNLLWQEWQTVAKARMLFVKLNALTQSQAVLQPQREKVRQRLDDARRAAAAGLVTRDAMTPQLTSFEDASRQLGEVARQRNQARHDLNALLGLAPEVEIVLTPPGELAPLDAASVQQALALAPRRRPDLLALQAGYEAQDARYRGALWAQFPAITVGPTRARDTSDVNTVGFSLGLSLPLFNRNRGNIAIESATRDKLRLEYQQRLDTDAIESHRLLEEQSVLQRQLDEIDASLPALIEAAGQAARALAAEDIDALTLGSVEGALLARRIERIDTRLALQEQAIALQALLGTPFDEPASRGAPAGESPP